MTMGRSRSAVSARGFDDATVPGIEREADAEPVHLVVDEEYGKCVALSAHAR